MINKYRDHDRFFKENGNFCVRTYFYDMDGSVTIEEMYQHFKARLLDELEVKNDDIGFGVIKSELVSKD